MTKKEKYLWIALAFSAGCILIMVFLFTRLESKYEQRIESLQDEIEQQSGSAEQFRRDNLMQVMAGLLEQADRELARSPDRRLSDETIGRLAILSDEFSPGPYTYLEDDSLSGRDLIAERGFLLKTLVAMSLDSSTWRKIMQQVSFAKANLEGADFRGVDLEGANLMRAHLKGADLRDAVLDSADLRGANLWGAKLQHVSGRQVRMNRADLRWANLDSADLLKAVLDGSFLEGAKLREVNLEKAVAAYAFFQNAMFGGTNLSGIRMFRTNLHGADFTHANLQDADLRECDFSGANVRNANLSRVLFRNTGIRESNWLELLEIRGVAGADSIRLEYAVEHNPSFESGYALVVRK